MGNGNLIRFVYEDMSDIISKYGRINFAVAGAFCMGVWLVRMIFLRQRQK